MIGWRGASRYYSEEYEYAFGMECKAIKRVREKMGLNNVTIMIPFCRTIKELKRVYKVMKKYGIERGKDGLEIYLMAELPSNIGGSKLSISTIILVIFFIYNAAIRCSTVLICILSLPIIVLLSALIILS